MFCLTDYSLDDPPKYDRERTLDRLKRKRKLSECFIIMRSSFSSVPYLLCGLFLDVYILKS